MSLLLLLSSPPPPAAWAAQLASHSPLAWYRQDESAGTTTLTDSSGNVRDGTYSSSTMPGATGLLASEPASTAAAYDGTNGATVPHASWMNFGSNLTALAWIRTTTASTTKSIIDRDDSGSQRQFQFRINTSGTIEFGHLGGAIFFVSGTTVLTDGVDRLVAATFDGTNLKVYVNGVLEGTTPCTTPLPSVTYRLGLGFHAGGAQRFTGTIDEVALLGTALTQPQLADLYTAGTVSTPTTPSGTGAGTLTYTGTASGISDRSGSSSGTLAYVGTATGSTSKSGSGVGALTYAGGGTGTTVKSGTASGSFAYSGAGTGTAVKAGSGAGSYAYTGVATGSSPHGGTGAGTVSYVGAGSGTAPPDGAASGSGSGTFSYAGMATGTAVKAGDGTGTYSYTGAATGATTATGSGSGSLAFTGDATGTTTKAGAGIGTYAYAGSATGTAPSPDRDVTVVSVGARWRDVQIDTRARGVTATTRHRELATVGRADPEPFTTRQRQVTIEERT